MMRTSLKFQNEPIQRSYLIQVEGWTKNKRIAEKYVGSTIQVVRKMYP